jgi:hypothetical protein
MLIRHGPAMPDDTAENAIGSVKMVHVQWPEPGPAIYANNLCVQYDGNSVFLTFAQVNPPLVVGKSEEETKQLCETISSVKATPVIRLVVPMENFRKMLELIHEHMSRVATIENIEKIKQGVKP